MTRVYWEQRGGVLGSRGRGFSPGFRDFREISKFYRFFKIRFSCRVFESNKSERKNSTPAADLFGEKPFQRYAGDRFYPRRCATTRSAAGTRYPAQSGAPHGTGIPAPQRHTSKRVRCMTSPAAPRRRPRPPPRCLQRHRWPHNRSIMRIFFFEARYRGRRRAPRVGPLRARPLGSTRTVSHHRCPGRGADGGENAPYHPRNIA